MTLPPKLKRYAREFDYSYTYGVFPTLELIDYQPENTLAVIIHTKGSKNKGVVKIRQACQNYQIKLIENDFLVDKLADRGDTYAIGVVQKYTSQLEFSRGSYCSGQSFQHGKPGNDFEIHARIRLPGSGGYRASSRSF